MAWKPQNVAITNDAPAPHVAIDVHDLETSVKPSPSDHGRKADRELAQRRIAPTLFHMRSMAERAEMLASSRMAIKSDENSGGTVRRRMPSPMSSDIMSEST